MVANILDFKALQKPEKFILPDLLLSKIIPRKLNFTLSPQKLSWISTWHNNTNFSNGLFNFTALFMVWKLQTVLVLKLIPISSFASVKRISAAIDTDLLLTMKMVAKSNART